MTALHGADSGAASTQYVYENALYALNAQAAGDIAGNIMSVNASLSAQL